MKPERLLAKYSLFKNDTLEEKYKKMKDAFVILLDRTEGRCNKFCEKKNDQERYASVHSDAVPGLTERNANISNSTQRVLSELAEIDRLESVDQKIDSLKSYVEGLAATKFNGLFMVILSGELNKRWVPFAKELAPTPEVHEFKNPGQSS